MTHPAITVVTLGPGDPSLLTLQAADALRSAKHLVLRTARHPVAAWLQEQEIAFEDLDSFYDAYDDFDEMHAAMAEALWQKAAKQPLTFAVMEAASDGAVSALRESLPEGAKLTCLAGISAADLCSAAHPAGAGTQGLRILPATALDTVHPDPDQPLLITEIDSQTLAGEVKLWLGDLYDDETSVVFYPPAESARRKAVSIELMALDRQKRYDHTTCVWVPAVPYTNRSRCRWEDLLSVMKRLRAPFGCPWDAEQTHQSLRPYLIEEAYEVAQAIDDDDPDALADELGDVLLQVAFHSEIAQACGEFNANDVATAICQKMIRRHPHVFGGENTDWETLKMAEKGMDSVGGMMADIPAALPALTRAAKIQAKAAKVGFDWDTPQEALPKVHEEADEVADALEGRDAAHLQEELGDLLFACVNVVRLAGADCEEVLNRASDKFVRRFTAMEALIKSDRKTLKDLTLPEMDVYWTRVKSTQQNS